MLSPSTERLDRTEKAEIYAERGVSHLWLLDPEIQTLEALRLEAKTHQVLETFGGDARVRAEPFEAVELPLAAL